MVKLLLLMISVVYQSALSYLKSLNIAYLIAMVPFLVVVTTNLGSKRTLAVTALYTFYDR